MPNPTIKLSKSEIKHHATCIAQNVMLRLGETFETMVFADGEHHNHRTKVFRDGSTEAYRALYRPLVAALNSSLKVFTKEDVQQLLLINYLVAQLAEKLMSLAIEPTSANNQTLASLYLNPKRDDYLLVTRRGMQVENVINHTLGAAAAQSLSADDYFVLNIMLDPKISIVPGFIENKLSMTQFIENVVDAFNHQPDFSQIPPKPARPLLDDKTLAMVRSMRDEQLAKAIKASEQAALEDELLAQAIVESRASEMIARAAERNREESARVRASAMARDPELIALGAAPPPAAESLPQRPPTAKSERRPRVPARNSDTHRALRESERIDAAFEARRERLSTTGVTARMPSYDAVEEKAAEEEQQRSRMHPLAPEVRRVSQRSSRAGFFARPRANTGLRPFSASGAARPAPPARPPSARVEPTRAMSPARPPLPEVAAPRPAPSVQARAQRPTPTLEIPPREENNYGFGCPGYL